MRKLFCIAIALLISTGIAFAQNDEQTTYDFGFRGLSNISDLDAFYDFNSSGFGAKSKAMGGVHLAFGNDGFSSFLNPATMIYTNKSLMSLDVVNSRDKIAGNSFMGNCDIDGEHTRLIQAGAVAPFTYLDRDWWFGGSYRTVYDLHYNLITPDYNFITLKNNDDTLDIESNVNAEQNRGIDAINVAIAANPHPNVAMGLNMNVFIRGYRENRWLNFAADDYSQADSTDSSISHQWDKSTFSGINFDLGILLDFDMVKAGITVSTPFTLNQSVLFLEQPTDDNGIVGFGLYNRLEAKHKFPMTFAGGLAYMPMENLTVAADFEHKPFSKITIDVDLESDLWTDIDNYSPMWEDLTQMRFGVEYLMDAGFAQVPLRAGVQNLPGLTKSYSRIVDYTENYIDSLYVNHDITVQDSITFGDQLNTYLISFGTGLKFEKIWFDIAYQFGSSEYDPVEIETYYNSDSYNSPFGPLSDPNGTLNNTVYLNPTKLEYSRLYFSVGMLF
ncbi:MAG: hypothetical protein J7K40_03595 [candidate division Zixibacteria bacterium]|nr:hypothetical protein [candidate division Zixibacteria bacterium]